MVGNFANALAGVSHRLVIKCAADSMCSKLHHCVVVSPDHQAEARMLQGSPVSAPTFKQAVDDYLPGLVFWQLG